MNYHGWINFCLAAAIFGLLGGLLGDGMMKMKEHAELKICSTPPPPPLNDFGIEIPFPAPPKEIAPIINPVRDPIH